MADTRQSDTIAALRPAIWLYIIWSLLGFLIVWMCYDLAYSGQGIKSMVLAIALAVLYIYLVATQFAYTIRLTAASILFRDASRGQFIARKAEIPVSQIHAVYLGHPNFILEQIDGSRQESVRSFATGAVVGMVSPAATPFIFTTRTEPWLALLTENGRVYAINLKPYSKKQCTALIQKLQGLHIPVNVQPELT
jgi:hypothetical protein